ncbi:hypothetical protein [Mesorhizobium sp. CN2-181]
MRKPGDNWPEYTPDIGPWGRFDIACRVLAVLVIGLGPFFL